MFEKSLSNSDWDGSRMMLRSSRVFKVLGTLAVAVAASLAIVPTASATTDIGYAYFDNGQRITANAWIQSFTWTSCGNFQTSAVMAVSPNYITNQTSFYQIGLGSIGVKGVNIDSSRQNSSTLRWTNSNGAKGSYLSGSVCGGWGAIYVGEDVAAQAFYYGNLRTASAHI